MKCKSKVRRMARLKKKAHIRKRISGTEARPRLVVFRSNKHISAQLINDDTHKVICSAGSFSKDLRPLLEGKTKTELSVEIGKVLAERAKANKIEKVVFDRNGFIYHGRIKALADACREAGLIF